MPLIASHRTSSGLNLRTVPLTGTVLAVLPPGELVLELSQTGEWSRVRTASTGKEGWVANRYLTPLIPAAPTQAGPSLAPATSLRPLTFSERQKLLGVIEFVPAPVAGNPENIKITNGWAQANVIAVNVPQLVGVKGASAQGSVWVHRKVAPQLLALFAAWEKAGLLKHILTWGGCYVPRLIRGSKTSLSLHAHASAFDINMEWNGLGATPAKAGTRGSVRELIPLAEAHGFYWGGNFSRRDGMHLEICRIQ